VLLVVEEEGKILEYHRVPLVGLGVEVAEIQI
jgi:hypothetical protein